MTDRTETRNKEIQGIIEAQWAIILDERAQTHQPDQSNYRFCSVFLEYFAKQDNCTCPAMDGPELLLFNDRLLPFLKKLSLNDREKTHILSALFERICNSIARPFKLGT